MARRITDCVATAARRQPNDHAVVDVRESTVCIWSWGKLWHESEKVAGLLLRLHVASAEPVAYQLPNCAEVVAITLGILRVGAVCCPLSPALDGGQLRVVLERSRARVLFVADEWAGRRHAEDIAALAPHCECLEHVIVVRTGVGKFPLPTNGGLTWERFHRATALAPPSSEILDQRRPTADSIAQLLFTQSASGSLTGILHRHEALMSATGLLAGRLSLEGTDRIVVACPIAEQTGFLYGMWLALALGLPQLLLGLWTPARALRVMRDWRASFIQASSNTLNELLHAAQTSLDVQLPLRLMVPVGEPVPRGLMARARDLHIGLCGAFGTPESCLATLVSPTEAIGKEGSYGRALPGVSLRSVDGQLEIRSATLFAGYLDDEKGTTDAYTADGWYRTGVQAWIDSDGFLYAAAERLEPVSQERPVLA